MALKTTKTGAGTDPAAEQKHNILLAAGPTVVYAAEKLKEEFNLLVLVGAVPKKAWKKRLPPLQAELEFLKPFDGYFGEEAFPDSIITEACELGELVFSFSKPPSSTFSAGFRAKSRITKLLKAAEGKEHTEYWAREYLLSTFTGIADQDEKATAIVNTLEASTPLSTDQFFRKAFVSSLEEKLLDSEKNLTTLGLKVYKRIRKISKEERRGPLKEFDSEFKEALLSPKEESKVQVERTLLFEPTSRVSSLQSEEPVDHKSIKLSFFKDQPPHILLNSALVLATAEVSKANELSRNILACKILLPIGKDFLVKGKSLSVPPTQEDLLERIKQIANQPEVKANVEAYHRLTIDEGNNTTVAERLLSLYEEEKAPPKHHFNQEVVDRLKSGEVIDSDSLDYSHINDASLRLMHSATLLRIPLVSYQTEALEARKKMVGKLLEGLDPLFIGAATGGETTQISPEMLVDLDALENLVMKVRLHEATTKLVQKDWNVRSIFEEYGTEALPYLVQAVSDVMATHSEEDAFDYLNDYVLHPINHGFSYNKDPEAKENALLEILQQAEFAGYTRLAAELKEMLEIVEEEQEQESEEEPEKVEEIADSLDIPKEKIFSVLEEVKPLLEQIALDELPIKQRMLAADELMQVLDINDGSPQKMVIELAALAYDEESSLSTKAVAAMLSLPHVSGYNWASRRNSSLLVTVLACVVQSNKDSLSPEIENKILHGSEKEADYAIDVLAQKVRLYGAKNFAFPESWPLQEIALAEAHRTAEPARFARLALAFKDLGVETETLNHYLELAMEKDRTAVQKTFLSVLNNHRAQMPGSIFPTASEEEYTRDEATLVEDFLQHIEGGEDTVRELSIAAAVSNIDSADAVEVALQRMHDSTEEDHTTAWAIVLQQSKALETDKLIMESTSKLEPEKQAAAITALSGRKLTPENAEFILEASHSKNAAVATAAGRALVKMDLSEIPPEDEFTVLYGMRNHPNASLSGVALERLQLFLSETNEIVAEENVEGLSNVHLDDNDPQLRELAKEALLKNPSDFIKEINIESLLSLLGEEDTVPTLSMYEIARQMHSGDIDCEAVSVAVDEFERQDNIVALTQLMTAAHTSGEKEHLERVLVPCLGMDEAVSQMAADFLLNNGNSGINVLLDAIKRENHPAGLSRERMKRISGKSLKLLLRTESYDLLVPLLGNQDRAVRSNVYDALEAAPNSSEKTSALLAAFSSENNKVKLAALNLIPEQETHLDRIVCLIEGEEKEVLLRAAEVAASLMTPERLIVFLAHDHESEFVRQRVADAILQNHPEKLDEISSYLEKEDAVLLADRKTVLSTLRFFQHPKALNQFFRFRDEADEAEMATIDNALRYFCETLSGAMPGRIEEPTEEDMHLLLEVYKHFNQDEVHNAILAASKGPFAKLLRNSALSTKDPDLLLSATDIFLSAGKLQYAAQLAHELMRTDSEKSNLTLTKPYQQILFGGQLNMLDEVISPVEDPGADPIQYRFLKEAVTTEFLHGRGSNESAEMFLEFMGTFGDMEGFFDHGLNSLSELIWASRADPEVDYDAVRKLPDRLPNNLVEEAQLLLEVLMLGKYDLLDKQPSPEVKNILVEHGLRRAVEAIEGTWIKSSAEKENSKMDFSLIAELMERSMVTEKEVHSLVDPCHPIVCALGASTEWWEEETVSEGLNMLEDVRAELHEAQSTARKLKKMREELGSMHTEEVSSEQALAAAKVLEKLRAPPPAGKGKPVKPKKPEKVERGSKPSKE